MGFGACTRPPEIIQQLLALRRFSKRDVPIQVGAFFAPYRRARSLFYCLNYIATAGFFGVLATEARW
jgi:hypothetical protein